MKDKIIALLVTDGKRDIKASINSILGQTLKPDEIIIASEVYFETKYKLYVNPYTKGLARNTMQALEKIYFNNLDKDIFIATLDDDDEWEKDYLYNASDAIAKGYNFITGNVTVYKDNKEHDIYIPEIKDFEPSTFLYENIGIQGSNKIFSLRIALESGGMFKNINASTDRTLNFNLLNHPEVKPYIINKSICRYHKDDDRKRITNDPNRVKELREFYKTFWNVIDKSKLEDINKRHKKLHGFDEVITWK